MFDWITIILVLLIIGVVLDGIRRVRSSRKSNIKLSRNAKKADVQFGADNSDLSSSEFPGGGARVVAYREEDEALELTKELKQNFEETKPNLGVASRIPEQVSLNLEESVPMLMESIEIEAQKAQDERESREARLASPNKTASITASEEKYSPGKGLAPSDKAQNEQEESLHKEPSIGSLDGLDAVDEYFKDEQTPPNIDSSLSDVCPSRHELVDENSEQETEVNEFTLGKENSYPDNDEPEISRDQVNKHKTESRKESLGEKIQRKIHEKIDVRFSDKRAEQSESGNEKIKHKADVDQNTAKDDSKKEYIEPDIVLVVNIMAPPGVVFTGEALLQALLGEGMKLGDMDIFHRHYENNGDAPVVFSLANMVMPGTFNLAQMSEFSTPGVSLFLGLPVEGDSLAAYNDLISTAQRLALSIGGELKDENRSVMTKQTIEHGKQRVVEYERKKKLAKA